MKHINKAHTLDLLMRLMKILIAFIIVSIGTIFMLKANLGMNPWGTLALGISKLIHISYGQANQLIGLAVLLLMTFFKVYPGLGTLLDLSLIGLMVHIIEQMEIVSTPDTFILQLTMCLIGLFMFCYGLLIYYRCGLGIGPRESIVMAVVRKTNQGFAKVKTTIESSVFVLGVLLGGDFGVGTIIITLLTGRLMEGLFTFHNFDVKTKEHLDLRHTLKYIRA